MAKTSLANIKNWFKTGLKPTQAQFWSTWDSFWHKDEKIAQEAVDQLPQTLDAKAEKQAFETHLTDAQSHHELFEAKVDKIAGKGLSTEDLTPQLKNRIQTALQPIDVQDVPDSPQKQLPASANQIKLLNDGNKIVNESIRNNPDFPQIKSDNFFFNDECIDDENFNYATGGLFTSTGRSIKGSRLELEADGSYVGVNCLFPEFDQNTDLLYYFKVGASILNIKTKARLRISDGSSNGLITLDLKLNPTSLKEDLYLTIAPPSTSPYELLLKGDVNFSKGLEILIHLDRTFNLVMFYMKDLDGMYTFLKSVPYETNFNNAIGFFFGVIAEQAALDEVNGIGFLDYFSVGPPNIVALGDSLCAGSNDWSPDQITNPDRNNYNSSWQRWANLQWHLRNNFVVNKGVGGYNSQEIEAMVKTIYDPEGSNYFAAPLAIIQMSSNDTGNITLGEKTTSVQNMVNSIIAENSKVILVNAGYGGDPSVIADSDTHKDWWDNYRNNVNGISYSIDYNEALNDETGYTDAKWITPTGHPKIAAYRVIGEYIASFENTRVFSNNSYLKRQN